MRLDIDEMTKSKQDGFNRSCESYNRSRESYNDISI